MKANKIYTKKNDGLKHSWNGKVFCNPPYARGLVTKFCDKFVSEAKKGNMEEGIILVISDSKTKWFHNLCKGADSVCLTKGIIRFIDADGNERPLFIGQTFFYIGKNVEKFERVFSTIGTCLELLTLLFDIVNMPETRE